MEKEIFIFKKKIFMKNFLVKKTATVLGMGK
jgi:hypothetical protein